MCGIVGFVGDGGRRELTAMTEALAHRGPDGSGYHVDHDHRVYLGHRRLAVIDVEGGAQPMWNEDGTVGVVFNGEIYNHRELRETLVAAGHRFASHHSDTEVLVHGYEEWGADLAGRLNGMFAFAIWDQRRALLYLARDRFGEKPLFYVAAPGFFAFASELRPFALHPRFDPTLDIEGLQKLFAYGFSPAPTTPFRAVRKLPGGHHLTLDVASGHSRVTRYWRFELRAEEKSGAREEELADELLAHFDRAVERRLVADVPLGVFLSGGIDSAAVLASATRAQRTQPIETFTIGFTEPSFDESANARACAEAFGSRHFEQVLDLDGARDLIPTLLADLAEPLGDASVVPTYLLSRFARQRVTVALSGDGGDELFAGYDPLAALAPSQLYSAVVPGFLHGLFKRLAHGLPISTRNMSFDFKMRRVLGALSYPSSMWNPVWLGPLGPEGVAALFPDTLTVRRLYEEAIALWESTPGADAYDRTLAFYTEYYLKDGVLTKVDRASMLNSLETRAAFLDNDLVDFCSRLPRRFKYRNGERKYLLRKALSRRLPASILGRRKKGFGMPTARWLREIPHLPPLEPVHGSDLSHAAGLWREHRSGEADHRLALWTWWSVQASLPAMVSPGAIDRTVGV